MEKRNFVIAINREFGSGGREIACKLGNLLGINVYDKDILDRLTKQFNLTVEEIESIKAKKTGWWGDFCQYYRQFSLSREMCNTVTEDREVTSKQIYYAEAQILRELAEKESCIIIGRSGFHVFKDNPSALKIFFIADINTRVRHIMNQYALDENAARKRIEQVDKARENYTKTFAGVSRYDARNYDFVINVSQLTTDSVAAFLADNIRKRYPHL